MPEAEVKKEEQTVDIDTSGPDVDIKLPEEKDPKEIEVKDEKQETSDKEQETKVEEKPVDEKPETKVEEKSEELEQYSEGVKKRIAKLMKKWREAERQKEAALDYAKGVQYEHSELKNKFSRLEPNYVKALESKVVSGIEAAKSKLAQAREAGDINAEVEAQKDIAKLGFEETRLAALKDRQSQEKEKVVKTPSLDQAVAPQKPDPKAEAWADKNDWFGKDSAMTYTAFDYHKKLTEQEGFDPNSDEYYAEIDKRMKLDFPHKFANTRSQESTKPEQIVASAKRSSNTGRKTVRLTSSQVAIAKKLGVPLEEYAKQLKLTKEV